MFGRKKNKTIEPPVLVEEGISLEVIAAISAAISSFEELSSASSLIIRKIDRRAGVVPAWRTAGISDQIDTRY